ncbi:hypothetical protein LZ30DRAFT_42825 [Colletotrichum cereale]|nr:hypothetical protein LZ30DRAFT_42825 [Colletotrichum cereale]
MHDTITRHRSCPRLQILNQTNSRHGTVIGRHAPTQMRRWHVTSLLGASGANPGSSGGRFPSQSHWGPSLRLSIQQTSRAQPPADITKESCCAEFFIKPRGPWRPSGESLASFQIFVTVTNLRILSAQYRSPMAHTTSCTTSRAETVCSCLLRSTCTATTSLPTQRQHSDSFSPKVDPKLHLKQYPFLLLLLCYLNSRQSLHNACLYQNTSRGYHH